MRDFRGENCMILSKVSQKDIVSRQRRGWGKTAKGRITLKSSPFRRKRNLRLSKKTHAKRNGGSRPECPKFVTSEQRHEPKPISPIRLQKRIVLPTKIFGISERMTLTGFSKGRWLLFRRILKQWGYSNTWKRRQGGCGISPTNLRISHIQMSIGKIFLSVGRMFYTS